MQKKKSTVKDLQKLCRILNFLRRAIFPGRTSTKRMYSKFAGIINLGSHNHLVTANQYKIKQHYHIRLDNEFKMDCNVWLEFLSDNLRGVVNRPMIDIIGTRTTSTVIEFYSDASKTIGFGAVLNDRWICGDWCQTFLKQEDPSIAYLELFALCAGVLTWEDHPELCNCRVTVYCDNTAVVEMINSMVSGCKNCMYLLWLITLNGLKFNRRLTAQYINTRENCLADALSRNQMDRFHKLGPEMLDTPDQIPNWIWPISQIWQTK